MCHIVSFRKPRFAETFDIETSRLFLALPTERFAPLSSPQADHSFVPLLESKAESLRRFHCSRASGFEDPPDWIVWVRPQTNPKWWLKQARGLPKTI